MTPEDKFELFKSVLGVFQGGGVKVTAMLGAYKKCIDEEVNFDGFAGTSGGAIIASLLAAGYNHDELKTKLEELDFNALLKSPLEIDKKFYKKSWLSKLKGIHKLLAITGYLGLYSSDNIVNWIEEAIIDKIGNQNPIPTFSDLPYPLFIIGADLLYKRHKIWSRYHTPEESISKAIRASIAIPMFFQPVVQEDGFYVDGGIVSNFPISILQDFIKDYFPSYTKVLGFRLINVVERSDVIFPWDTATYFRNLSDTIVEGNVSIQSSHSPTSMIIPISIKNSEIDSTGFDKLTKEKKLKLYSIGEEAAKKFFSNIYTEWNKIYNYHQYQILNFTGEYLSHVQRGIVDAKQEVFIFTSDIDWIFSLIMSIIYSRVVNNTKINFVLYPRSSGDAVANRLNLLKSIGCNVVIKERLDEPEFLGFICDWKNKLNAKVIVEKRGRSTLYTKYVAPFDYYIIEKICSSLTENLTFNLPCINKVEVFPVEELYKMLRNEAAYSNSSIVEFSIEEVKVCDISPLQATVKLHKFNQVYSMIKLYKNLNVSIFTPICVTLFNGKKSVIVPPVVEYKGESDLKYALIEGHSRISFCRMQKIDKVNVIIVKNVDVRLPNTPKTWDKVKIIDKWDFDKLEPRSYAENLKRNIERVCHNVEDWRNSD